MESHIAARDAAEHGLPFAVVRVVIDPADQALPAAAEVGLREDGSPNLPAVLQSVAQHPTQLPALMRLAYCAAIAKKALHEIRGALGEALAHPSFATLAAPGLEPTSVGDLLLRDCP
jgi:hypothetical protein